MVFVRVTMTMAIKRYSPFENYLFSGYLWIYSKILWVKTGKLIVIIVVNNAITNIIVIYLL